MELEVGADKLADQGLALSVREPDGWLAGSGRRDDHGMDLPGNHLRILWLHHPNAGRSGTGVARVAGGYVPASFDIALHGVRSSLLTGHRKAKNQHHCLDRVYHVLHSF